MSNELKLGIFVTIGIIAVLITIMMLGNYSLTSKYIVNTYFENTAGLPKKSKVKISGVDVGNIKNIVLENGRAKVVLVIDKNITFADLKGTLAEFARELFGEDTKVKFRPHHFPFTEPSAEVDVSCFKCKGAGCRFCKGSGWIEILGCGMVHPRVLKMSGIDPEEYTGFAFGVGLERIALLKYEIDDMRLLYENDDRFLKQF